MNRREGGAPSCRHPKCGNSTWNPSGFCFLHEGSGSVGDRGSSLSLSSPSLRSDDSESPETIGEAVRAALPDIEEPVSPNSIRDQAENTIRAAISVDVYRRFPEMDSSNPDDVRKSLEQYNHQLREQCYIIPVQYTDSNAVELSRSSSDVYGRSLDDSVGLTSWAVKKEWDFAQSIGKETDKNGVPYGDSLSDYCDSVNKQFSDVVDDELDNQVNHYTDIVEESTGKPSQVVQNTPEPQPSPQQYAPPTAAQPANPTVAAPNPYGPQAQQPSNYGSPAGNTQPGYPINPAAGYPAPGGMQAQGGGVGTAPAPQTQQAYSVRPVTTNQTQAAQGQQREESVAKETAQYMLNAYKNHRAKERGKRQQEADKARLKQEKKWDKRQRTVMKQQHDYYNQNLPWYRRKGW